MGGAVVRPSFRSPAEQTLWLLVDAALILFIARGSRTAIALSLALTASAAVALVAAAAPASPSGAAVLAVALAQAALLVALWRSTPGRRPSREPEVVRPVYRA